MLPPRRTLLVPHLGGIDVGYRSSKATPDLSKPTLVLFNPFTTTADYYIPEFQNNAIQTPMNLLAVEPLGHGKTRLHRGETFTYWDSAVMSLQLLDALGIDKAFVLGTSQGGWIAARMALLAPGRVCGNRLDCQVQQSLTTSQIQGIILIGSSMDSESIRSREAGCWDGSTVCSGLVSLAADFSPAHDFQPGDAYYDFLVEIGFGNNVDKVTKDFWAKTIKDNYQGDEGKRRICMAAVNLSSRDGLHERLPYIRCPVLWLQVCFPSAFDLKLFPNFNHEREF